MCQKNAHLLRVNSDFLWGRRAKIPLARAQLPTFFRDSPQCKGLMGAQLARQVVEQAYSARRCFYAPLVAEGLTKRRRNCSGAVDFIEHNKKPRQLKTAWVLLGLLLMG